MVEKRAYFTPSPELAPTLAAKLLFDGAEDHNGITFFVETDDNPDLVIPVLVEVRIEPVTMITTTKDGFEVVGIRHETIDTLAKLSIDTTVEPPVAMYSEPTQYES